MIDGGRGKIHATARDLARVLDDAPSRSAGEVRVLVTHVSPGKEPIVGLLAAALDVDVTISGHMGAPFACVWNDFAVRDYGEAEARLTGSLAALPENVRDRLSMPPRGERDPAWYRGTFHINLPDAPDGHAVLALDDGRLRLETASHGLRVRA